MNLGKVLALRPITDRLDLGFVRNMPIKGTFVLNDSCIQCSKHKTFSRYCCTNVVQVLEGLVNDREVLPNEVMNAQIVRNSLIRAIQVFVSGCNRLDR